jgi:hypothetical protein
MEFYIMAIKKSSGSGIPSGNTAGRPANPGLGQLYSNGEAARLELYTQASGWQNIIQEVPGVASIAGTYLESTGTATIAINGTNFVSGAIASAIGTNAVEVQATSTTYNSLVQLTAVFTGLSNQYEPYDIKVTNPSNLFGLIPDALFINANPIWTTPAGSLGTFGEQVSISVSAVASDDSILTYSLASGSSLPSGVTLNSATGLISGTLPDIASNTTYTFTINATDGLNPTISRTFSFVSNAAPTWVTTSGSLGTFTAETNLNIQLSATDPSETRVYALSSGSLPSGVTLSSSGLISGITASVASNTTYNFAVSVSDGINPVILRSFSFILAPATVFYAPFTANTTEEINNVSPTQNTNGGIQSVAGYNGLRLSSQKTAFDGNVPAISRMAGSSWTAEFWLYKNSTNSSSTEIEFGSGAGGFYTNGILSRPPDSYFNGAPLGWPNNRPTGSWIHVAYVGDNGTLRQYENGTQVNSSVLSTSIAAPVGIWLGGSQHTVPTGTSQTMDGYLRKVRLSAIARYPNGTTFSPSSVFPI